MYKNGLITRFLEKLPFIPTDEQRIVLDKVADFLLTREQDTLLLFTGYAGTGKTSLMGAVVQVLQDMRQKTVLLAPTGRAAKVFSGYAHQKAFTIHKKIYRQKAFSNEMSGFGLSENRDRDTLFIVDEASMITNGGDSVFGSGSLLTDLVEYVYSGENCRLILMGDRAQLPPVMQPGSPALDMEVLRSFFLTVTEVSMTQVVRQTEDSGILFNATHIREMLRLGKINLYPTIRVKGFADIRVVPGDELIDQLSQSYDRVGLEETMVICRSNKQATIYNNGIRNQVLYREEELSAGDLLMVARNYYYWKNDPEKAGRENTDFIANGEIVEVRRVRKTIEMYDFRFCDLEVRYQEDEQEGEVRILCDSLHTDVPSLSKEDNDRLFYTILEDYEDIPTKAGKMKKMKADPYYNALQVKYAYAITCHKAQGGQWKNIFLDIGYMTEEMLGEDFYRWLYTAFTRATEKLYLVNLAPEFLEEKP